MWQAATSIVLIVGQLAVLAAAPAYVCTSADGTQRLEWGDCGCDDGHEHGAEAHGGWRPSMSPWNVPHVADVPCHCEHQPLSSDLRLMSRAEPDMRGQSMSALCCEGAARISFRPASAAKVIDCGPCGHTPLSDRLSICLRC